MELLFEKVLDDLLVNQDKLTKTERVKLFVTLSGHLFPKNKPIKVLTEEGFETVNYVNRNDGGMAQKTRVF